jgi:uncharacterized Ntn-hydrolase superfamily protein
VTFSLVGRCAETGMLGVVVSSSSPAVAARCAHVRAGVGAAASQNVTDPRLGGALLDAMAAGLGAEEAIAAVTRHRPAIAFRQLTAVDAAGRAAVFSGERTLGVHAARAAPDAAAAGNLLASEAVVDAMLEAFAATAGHLGDRLVTALQAGLAAGGEAGPVRSAGLLVADRVAWPVADLRVDWDDEPVDALAALWERWSPQLSEYVTRALDPAAAPAYGVAGDEPVKEPT